METAVIIIAVFAAGGAAYWAGYRFGELRGREAGKIEGRNEVVAQYEAERRELLQRNKEALARITTNVSEDELDEDTKQWLRDSLSF